MHEFPSVRPGNLPRISPLFANLAYNMFFFTSCDADPEALAKYVYALVKKDKSVEALRQGMIEQLEVFLQSGNGVSGFWWV